MAYLKEDLDALYWRNKGARHDSRYAPRYQILLRHWGRMDALAMSMRMRELVAQDSSLLADILKREVPSPERIINLRQAVRRCWYRHVFRSIRTILRNPHGLGLYLHFLTAAECITPV